MASQTTSSYHLNQWSPQDAFLRTEFNEDNHKIDRALAALAGRTDQTEEQLARQLPPLQHGLYNLLLQNHYEGKETGYKRALFFDGFQDATRVGTTEPGAHYDSAEKRLRIYNQGMQSHATGFAVEIGASTPAHNDGDVCAWIGSTSGYWSSDVTLTPTGFGHLSAVTLRMTAMNAAYGTVTAKVSILDGNQVLATSGTITVASYNSFQDYQLQFASPVTLSPKPYTLRVTNVSQKYFLRVAYTARGSQHMGAIFTFTPANYTTGAFTSTGLNLESDYTGARAWVRHVGGTVGLALKGSTGNYLPMERTGVRQTVNLQGVACSESSFVLTTPPAAPNRQSVARLTLDTGGGQCGVCDYGIIFL